MEYCPVLLALDNLLFYAMHTPSLSTTIEDFEKFPDDGINNLSERWYKSIENTLMIE